MIQQYTCNRYMKYVTYCLLIYEVVTTNKSYYTQSHTTRIERITCITTLHRLQILGARQHHYARWRPSTLSRRSAFSAENQPRLPGVGWFR